MSEQSNLYSANHEYEDMEPRHPRTKKRRSRGKKVWKVLGTILLIMLCTTAILACFAAVYVKTVILPQAHLDLSAVNVNENSVMYYLDKETGTYKELVTMLSSEDSIWVDYKDIPKNLINAAIAIEDKRFYSHPGIDWRRIGRAAIDMFTGNSISGGSTITQQLIKNITQRDEVTVKRKVIEIFKALEFDKTYGKDTTMEWYLNYIYLGSRCRGVGSASYKYFGKPVQELTLAECASLISITNNPSIYGPYSDVKIKNADGELWTAKQWNKYRQENVLYQMLKQDMISQAEYDEAVAQELVFVQGEAEQNSTTIYSWYEEQVRKDVMADLMDKYNITSALAAQMLSTGGLRIYTCVDPTVQNQVEKVYNNEKNLDYHSSKGKHLQSAITVIDNATGDLVGLAGSLGQKTGNLWLNMATEIKRQPGSSIKPIAVYAPAVDMGLISPVSVLDDYPHEILGGKPWPVNVDHKYRGLVTVREALANSYNTVSVRVLADLVTPAKGFDYAKNKFHLETLVESRQGRDRVYTDIAVSPLATGGLTDGTNTRDMAAAFAVFPNNGIYRTPRTYTRVENSSGEIILEKESHQEVAVKDTTAYYMNSMLRSVVTSGGGTAANFNGGMSIAGKTGTTDSKHDRWFVGYTPYYTAACWVGYEQPERVKAPGNPALNMWKLVMADLHKGLANRQFTKPAGLQAVTVCKDSGMLATEFCKQDPRGSDRFVSDYLFPEDIPSGYCNVHTQESTITVCTDSPVLNADQAPTGIFNLAGPHCPETSQRVMSFLNYNRESIGGAQAADSPYLFQSVQSLGPCTVHTEETPVEPPLPPDYDPNDPNTWPPSVDPSVPTDPDTPDQPANPDVAPPPPPDPNINPATGLPYGL